MVRHFILLSYLIFCSFVIESQNLNSEISKYSSYYKYEDNCVMQTDTIEIQINNKTGEDDAKISIPYSKSEKLQNFKAWITDNKGNIVRYLKKSEIIDRNQYTEYLYTDKFEKAFSLNYNSYPYKVCYRYTKEIKEFIYIAYWAPKFSDIVIRNAKLNVAIANNIEIDFYQENIGSPSHNKNEKYTIYEWNINNFSSIKNELFSPDISNLLPTVIVSPHEFTYGINGKLNDWKSYGDWYYNLTKGLDDLPVSEKINVDNLLNGISDKKEKIKILYYYLQDHTHYVNVSIGIGGLKPYSAEYVARNKYGDCKALTNYMKSLLKCAGITSYFTLIGAGEKIPNLCAYAPGPQFNHIILAIPIADDTIYLDNTSSIFPFEYTSYQLQNRPALLIDEGKSKIIKMPIQKETDILNERKIKLILKENGLASAIISENFRGKEFEEFCSFKAELNGFEQNKYIKDWFSFPSFDLLKWELHKYNRDSVRIRLASELNIYNFISKYNNNIYFEIIPFSIPKFEPLNERDLPVEIPYPIIKEDTIFYLFPPNYRLRSFIEDKQLSSKYGSYCLNIKDMGDSLLVSKKLYIKDGFYQLNEYKDFYDFITRIKELDKSKIIITR